MSNQSVDIRVVMTVSLLAILIATVMMVTSREAFAVETHEVEILRGSTTLADKSYSPNPVEVVKGDTIRFVNKDSVLHTATSGDGSAATPTPSGVFDSGFLGPNKASEVTINEVGEIPYYCQAHPTMVGLVKVSEGTLGNTPFAVTAAYDGSSYEITGVSSSSARATTATINANVSVVLKFDGSGEVELTFPMSMIQGINSVATSDGTAVPFTKTDESGSSTTIKLTIPDGGDGSVVIMGARVVPEILSVAFFVVTGSFAAATVVVARFSMRNRCSLRL